VKEGVNMEFTQSVWRWKVAFDLFFAGLAAGLYVIGTICTLMGYTFLGKMAIFLSIPILIISTLVLMWDLELPGKLISVQPLGNLLSNWRKSWISRGAFIVSLFLILGLINIAFWIWPFTILESAVGVRSFLQLIVSILAILTMSYTGILMGVMIGRPLWNNPILPLLFVVSAFSMGIGGIFFLLPFGMGEVDEFMTLIRGLWMSIIILIILEALSIYFYLSIISKTFKEGVDLLIKGKLRALFWGGLITIGLIIPFIIGFIALNIRQTGGALLSTTLITGACLLIGGLFLRVLILFGGIRSPINVEVPFYVRPEV